MNNGLEALLDAAFVFQNRPVSVHPDLRPLRRVALLLLLVKACRNDEASLEQIHLLDWAVRTEQSRRILLECLSGQSSPDQAVVRFDPSLIRAISFAQATGVLAVTQRTQGSSTRPDYKIEITLEGARVVEELDATVFTSEREFLSAMPRRLTKVDAKRLFVAGTSS